MALCVNLTKSILGSPNNSISYLPEAAIVIDFVAVSEAFV